MPVRQCRASSPNKNRRMENIQIGRWGPEIELLLSCVRTRMDPPLVDRATTLLAGDLDWDLLIRTARRQGVAPLFAWTLQSTFSHLVPAAYLAQCRQVLQARAKRNLSLVGELLGLLKLFEAHGVQAVPFKGLVLAAVAYGNVALRAFGDLDILVHKRDVPKARRLLVGRGFRQLKPSLALSDEQEALYLDLTHEYAFGREDGLLVEVQWDFSARSFSFPLAPEGVWRRLATVSLAGMTVPRFAPEDELLILCIDGAKMCWKNSLKRLCDVAALIRSHPGLHWNAMTARAHRLGGERMLLLGLWLAHDLLGAPLPDAVLRSIQADPKVQQLAMKVYKRLFAKTDSPLGLIEEQLFSLFHLQARERVRDKLRYCLRAMIPTAKDWAYLPLPRYLAPLYYLIRPVRLAQHVVRPLLP